MKDILDYSLFHHNTFGISARCRRFLEFATVGEAVEAARIIRSSDMPFLIIGGGSNLLLTKDFDGIVVRSAIRGIDNVEAEDASISPRLLCGSGEKWDNVVAESLRRKCFGAENLSLIPGDVGASVVQNIGAYGVEVKDLVARVEAVSIADGEVKWFDCADLGYGYRDSRFKHDLKNRFLITQVEYRFSSEFQPRLDYGNLRRELAGRGFAGEDVSAKLTAEQLREVVIAVRQAKLPAPEVLGNAGSFFMNPVVSQEKLAELIADYPEMPHYQSGTQGVKVPAGWLIDQCGWRGRSLGRAGVYERQALVLVNLGGAEGCEVVDLCHKIQADVKAKFGITITPEVNIV
ncbi:MAG: UDP-N-acetylmuramate dehydrogenase [Prevotella sp.]|nr:UDP-N-acetylmuramate dehydrogenase [Prevotella sp.]